MNRIKQYLSIESNRYGYILFAITTFIIFIFSFISGPFASNINGLINIALTPDNLITDYIDVGGLGGAFLNVGLVTILAMITILLSRADITGPVIAGLFTVIGFAFFGKDVTNVIPIFLGVYLNSVYQKQPFKQHIVAALFGTTMSPIVSAIILYPTLNPLLAFALGNLVGLGLGFILPFVAKMAYKIHNGFNLYNIGFSSGLILMVLVSFLRVIGFGVEPALSWSEGNNLLLSIFLGSLYLVLIILAYFNKQNPYQKLVLLNKESGVAPSDFYLTFGPANTFINMALIGGISHIFILIFNVPLNGPTIGGVLTIIAFGAYGKNIRNVSYILLGAAIGHFAGLWQMTTPGVILGALFGTGIAPIAGKFGIIVGFFAITLHISLVRFVGPLYLGLNLYNNGFAEGFTGFLIPAIMNGIRQKKEEAS